MSIVMPSSYAELHTPRAMLSGSLSELDREQSLSTPRGGGELRSALPHFVRTHSCTHSSQPLPSPRHMASWSGQLTDLNGAGAGMQSKSQAYEHKTAAYMRTGCNAFKSNDSLPVCPLKVPTRLPLLRSWAVHAAYRSEFAQEIEAQQTPRYMNSNPHTAQAFGVAPAPRPIHTGPATPRNRAFQVVPKLSVRESFQSSSLSGALSEEAISSPRTPVSQIKCEIPKHLLVPPLAPIKKRKCTDRMPF